MITEGSIIPKGYGIGFYKPNRRVAYAYPIPINKLVAYGLKVWYWLRSDLVKNAYTDGFNKGNKEGFAYGENKYRRFVLDNMVTLGDKVEELQNLIESKQSNHLDNGKGESKPTPTDREGK